MSTAETINIESLLHDVAGDNPCGASLRWEPIYDAIKSERPQGDKDALLDVQDDTGDWPKIIALTSQVLVEDSKDLQFVAWLTEALTHARGFAGLRDGLKLCTALIDKFWDGLYPEIDEDGDLQVRVAPLVWLTEEDSGAKLPLYLKSLPLTPPDMDGTTYNFNFYNSRFTQKQGDQEDDNTYKRRLQEAEKAEEVFEQSVAAAEPAFYATLYGDIQETLEQLAEFGRITDEKFGFVAPSTSPTKKTLEEVGNLIKRIGDRKGSFAEEEAEAAAAEAEEGAEAMLENGDGGGGGGGTKIVHRPGPIDTRDEALRRLEEVADYFQRTEPQSPVPHLIRRAVNWCRLPFDRLLEELVKNEDARHSITEMLGLRSDDEQ